MDIVECCNLHLSNSLFLVSCRARTHTITESNSLGEEVFYACSIRACSGTHNASEICNHPTPLRQSLQQMTVIAPVAFAVEPGHGVPELALAASWQPSHVLLTG